ncbi:MAG: hypothetical protein ACI4JQ_03455 [Ruminococcus sp.]
MPYTVKSSEKLRKSAADSETKALLYLMNFRNDSREIYYFVVDFFNDLTGMDRYSSKLWDIQSKAEKNNSPNAIGRELVTLYKNYISELDFAYYILFFGGMSIKHLVNSTLTSFGIENLADDAKRKVTEGLKKEAKKKTYIDNTTITDDRIDDFLTKVLFVIDDKEPIEYVRAIIKDHPAIIPEEHVLTAIFNEIRNKQSEKKNTCVEGITISTTDEVLNYCRHLTSSEIRLLTLQRMINQNPVEKGVPSCFIPIYNSWVAEKQNEMLDECKQSLCRALFNKNAADSFWTLFECIYNTIIKNPDWNVEEIYRSLDFKIKSASPDFDTLSLKYFIAVVKGGLQGDN